ncbi:PqiC family protein [Agaribacterium haliotis]|uniref:PqiC family protein n=1 Tax=Agaribacterium haliotis TaxID=2013869 RepID=UPI000BB58C4C|nr:PqiC family protein [Agaribacterium haliotis]
MNKLCVRAAVMLLCAAAAACSSSGPATSYYSLFAQQQPLEQAEVISVPSKKISALGIGPVNVAGYLKNTAIVSRKQGQGLAVSGAHAWAEALDSAIARVVAAELDDGMQALSVQSFPWDSRSRPRWQLRIDVQEFDGERPGPVRARLQWTLFDVEASTELARGRYRHSLESGASYEAYVQSLNQLLNDFSAELKKELEGLDIL